VAPRSRLAVVYAGAPVAFAAASTIVTSISGSKRRRTTHDLAERSPPCGRQPGASTTQAVGCYIGISRDDARWSRALSREVFSGRSPERRGTYSKDVDRCSRSLRHVPSPGG